MIEDYELANDINPLFENKIVLYGAGDYGKRVKNLLGDIHLDVFLFCDKRALERGCLTYLDIPVISIDNLRELVLKENIVIIISSKLYTDNIIEELKSKQIYDLCGIYTYYGIQSSIALHINDERIPAEYRDSYKMKKELELRNYNRISQAEIIQKCIFDTPDVLVYQPGKVGSTTLYQSLLKAGINCIHVHRFWYDKMDIYVKENMKAAIDELKKKDELKIITAVRDPIARILSSFMQNYFRDIANEGISNLKDGLIGFIKNRVTCEFDWFDNNIKRNFGIDILEYDFDKSRGYGIIEEHNIKILILTMEKMNENEDIIREFVDIPDFKLENYNVGEEKEYKWIYEGIKKNMLIPEEIIQSCNSDIRFKHFYSKL